MQVHKLHRKTRLSGTWERYRSAGLITRPLDVNEQRRHTPNQHHPPWLTHTQTRRSNYTRAAEMLQSHCSGCESELGCVAVQGNVHLQHLNVPGHFIHSENTSNQTANPCWEFTNEDVDSEFLPVTVGKVRRWSSSGVSSTLGQSYWHLM